MNSVKLRNERNIKKEIKAKGQKTIQEMKEINIKNEKKNPLEKNNKKKSIKRIVKLGFEPII